MVIEMRIVILSDFDGTIIHSDGFEELLKIYAKTEYPSLMSAFNQERIDSETLLKRGFDALLQRATLADLNQTLDKIQVDPSFPLLAKFCKENEYELIIVSDGLDWYIKRILGRYGLENLPTITNIVAFDDNHVRLSFPWRDMQCRICHGHYGTCKGKVVREYKNNGAYVAIIGDGLTDRCGIYDADLIFAKSKLKTYCSGAGYPFCEFHDFTDIINALRNASLQ